ncbi:hypothetical protein K432DRAFT_405396 [Lepidopterella palustris CBS 459.81]|uniref:EKC/KEOPS complex subunit GON7 n=1 Tax=Lepidopterella palustris CBS 459.81 TaxID=1314670 RepID=A0A8E2E938_9PEZI|nr:hypothetical protein K432DRAFT_405396 [Lepidopterella palustris CBS 459.81]
MPNLAATYTSPSYSSSSPKIFIHPLPTLRTSIASDRTAYLSTLRSSITLLQTSINAFLTQRMEEDNTASAKGVDEAKEEENYGEEISGQD